LGLKNGLQAAHSAQSIPFGQRSALFMIAKHQTVSVKQLAQGLCISSGAATQHLDALVDAGLVVRGSDPLDRRGVVITLSDEGKLLFAKLLKERLELVAKLFDDVSDKDLELLVGIIEKLPEKVKKLG